MVTQNKITRIQYGLHQNARHQQGSGVAQDKGQGQGQLRRDRTQRQRLEVLGNILSFQTSREHRHARNDFEFIL